MPKVREINTVDELDHEDFLQAERLMRQRGTLTPVDAVELVSDCVVTGNIAQFNADFRGRVSSFLQ